MLPSFQLSEKGQQLVRPWLDQAQSRLAGICIASSNIDIGGHYLVIDFQITSTGFQASKKVKILVAPFTDVLNRTDSMTDDLP